MENQTARRSYIKMFLNWEVLLFIEIFIFIFISGFFSGAWYRDVQVVMYILIYLTCTFSLKRLRKTMLILAISMISLQLGGLWLKVEWLMAVLSLANFTFFTLSVGLIIGQIIRAKEVDFPLIFKSVIVYLLLGIIFTGLTGLLIRVDPGAFSFSAGETIQPYNQIYFSFVTMTTVGFGDLLPLTNVAKALSILIAVSGQLYLTVVIAVIVGKYLGSAK